MFEKEAEEYTKQRAKELGINDLCLAYHAIQRAYKKGAEFGYNKGRNEAKEIIKKLLNSCFGYNSKTVNYEVKAEAEAFLKE